MIAAHAGGNFADSALPEGHGLLHFSVAITGPQYAAIAAMFKHAKYVAALELAFYAAAVVFMGFRSGSSFSFAVLVFAAIIGLPLVWLVLAARLWVGLAVAEAVAPNGGPRLFVAAAAVGLLFSTFFVLIQGGSRIAWSEVWFPIAATVIAQVGAAARMVHAERHPPEERPGEPSAS